MKTLTGIAPGVIGGVDLLDADRSRWFAISTRSRHEKTVAAHFERNSIESFLPLYDVTRLWRNGKHLVRIPLFPGYLFANFPLSRRLYVLRVPGVVGVVGVNGVASPLEDEEMGNLKLALAAGVGIMPHTFLGLGSRVRVKGGPLAGLEGTLKGRRGNSRLVVSIEIIRRSVSLEIDSADVEGI